MRGRKWGIAGAAGAATLASGAANGGPMGDARESVRKVEREHEPGRPGCPVRRGADGTWEVRGYAAAREVLRATDTVQAGLGIETVEKL